VLAALDAAEVRRWAAGCVEALDAHRAAIDRINVFPVADADTGANLLRTMRAALESLLRAPQEERADAAGALAVLARGAVTGASGNSGVILSQMLRGFAEAADGAGWTADGLADGLTDDGLRAALRAAARLAVEAVAEPVAGTMLTVLDDAATAAESVTGGLGEVARGAADAAAISLAATPDLLPALRAAGVVDAGGLGVLVVLDELVAVVIGQRPNRPAFAAPARQPAATVNHLMETQREDGSDEFGYEVMYLLADAGTDERRRVERLRDTLVSLGDSVTVAGDGDGMWAVHVHCNDIGAAIEAGIDTGGRVSGIRVARFADARRAPRSRYAKDRAVVVAARGTALAALLRDEGAAVLTVPDGPEPTAYDLLEVIAGTEAAHVTVLPADVGLMALADEAAIRAVAAGRDAVVVPCQSPVQVLAALAVHDPRRRADDDVVAMAEAAALTRRGEVSVATGDGLTWVGSCRAGDALGFVDGEVILIEPGPTSPEQLARAGCGVVDRMLATGGELVTALLGADALDAVTDELRVHLHDEHPETDLVVYRGGQPGIVVTFGVE
jgi:DAK2 domain fusion protein YloV